MAGSGPASETTPSIKSSNSAGSGSGLSPADSLYQVKLLAALRSGDPALIHPFLTEIGKDRRNSISGQSQAQAKGNDYDTGAAALHLAIRCASVPTITLLLSHRAISPNGIHPPGSGNTPLHLAASLGRVDVVNLLLEQEGINDTIRDSQGRSVKDVAKTKEVTKALQDSHTFLNATYRSLLHSYVASPTNPPSPPPPALISLLSSPRIAHVNLSYLDDTNGQSLLHEAARRKDLRLLELALRAGADVFVRNRRGRVAFEKDKEGGEVDERVRVFLRQFANQDATLLDDSTSSLNHPVVLESPTLKGYLNKYANVAKGYNTRWFVLQNGVLSYYRHQEDELIASRGSISMRSATLKPSSSDRNRFEIYSTPTTKHHHSSSEPHSGQKWYIKANHHGEAARWVNAIRRSIEWCARQDGILHSPGASGGSGSVVSSPVVGPGESGRSTPILIKTPDIGGGSNQGGGRGSSPSPGGRTGTLLRKKKNTASGNYSTLSASVTSGMSTGNGSDHESIHSTRGGGASGMLGPSGGGGTDDERSIRSGSLRSSWMPSGTPSSVRATGPVTGVASSGTMADEEAYTSGGGGGGGGLDDDHAEEDSIEIVENEDKLLAPYEDSIALQANTLLAQLDITKELIGHLTSPPPAPGTSGPGLVPSSPIKGTMSKRETDLKTGLSASFATLESSVKEYVAKIGERDGWYKRKVADMRKEVEGWEGMVRTVVREGEGLEKELRDRARRRGSRMFLDVSESGPGGGSTIKNRPSVLARALKATREEEPSEPLKRPTLDGLPSMVTQEEVKTPTPASPVSVATPISLSQSRFISPTIASSEVKGAETAVDDEDQYDTDEEDEFFDAIESGTLPGLVVDEALLSSTTQGSIKSSSLALSPPPYSTSAPSIPDSSSGKLVPPSQSYLSFLSSYARQYQGYVDLRASLDLSGKEMPSTSLWSVLKHSIGKDLTKISFPVHFNEPTSMLQRMGEDMEFSGCLDAAAKERDPLRRIAFVAAFAMSNYSSTIGRIAKPFNPMLSETFEYVRLDKQYRYMSEQVSHHPPISACWAESPTWHYYGEVDAQNKFMGKSFEIRPTGVAHAELLIPEDRITRGKDGYPKAKGRHGKGKVVEHYTWKKVTTNISGFILGSPTIDHYGDMVVTNHRTGDQCILTFKPRGWRGKDAYEIAGHVIDASTDMVAYDIAGRWNSQLIARPTANNPSRASLDPDLEVRDRNASNITTPTSPLSSNAPFLLWINSEKPAGSPFNLTPYAITLNDCPSSLRPYLCPTDCRLRPDQRAFELGEYDLANDLKRAQEEKQRSIRKMREEGRLAPHRPRWFVAETDGDTGERVWTPIRVGDSEDGPIDQDWGLEYWAERDKVAKEIDEKASSAKGKTKWKGVEDIFIETPDFVKELMEEQEAKNL